MRIIKKTYTIHFRNTKYPFDVYVLCNTKIQKREKVRIKKYQSTNDANYQKINS